MPETAEAPVKVPATPIPFDDLVTGKRILVLYWCSHLMPDGKDAGRFETVHATVVGVGPVYACVELSLNTLPSDWVGVWPAPDGSFLRFVDPKKCFASHNEAIRYTQENPGLTK